MKEKKYVAQPDFDEEKTKSEDISQFEVVSCPPKSSIDKLCTKIRNGDLNNLKNLDFNKLTKDEKNKIEESIYAMMVEYKHTPLELDGSFPKELYKILEDKWHFCLQSEKEIRDSTLARMLPDLTKSQIKNVVKRHNNRFTPKYRAFSIFQNKIEEVVRKSTKLWKIIYKKIDDVFDEEYKVEASAKEKETNEERRKKVEEKKVEEKKEEEEKKNEENDEMSKEEEQE